MRRGRIDFTGTAEDLARLFHETYLRVSPTFMEPGSTVSPWEQCRQWYRDLLIATFEELLFGEQAGQPDERAVTGEELEARLAAIERRLIGIDARLVRIEGLLVDIKEVAIQIRTGQGERLPAIEQRLARLEEITLSITPTGPRKPKGPRLPPELTAAEQRRIMDLLERTMMRQWPAPAPEGKG